MERLSPVGLSWRTQLHGSWKNVFQMGFSGKTHLIFKKKRSTACWTTWGPTRPVDLSHSYGCWTAHSWRIQKRLQSMHRPSNRLRPYHLLQSLMRKSLSFQIDSDDIDLEGDKDDHDNDCSGQSSKSPDSSDDSQSPDHDVPMGHLDQVILGGSHIVCYMLWRHCLKCIMHHHYII